VSWSDLRTGIGVDAHPLVAGRPMALACLAWPDEPAGPDGHSDGDVAAHAVCDALLTAAGLGDLGTVFGTDRPEMAGATGAEMLADVAARVRAEGWSILSVSVQVVSEVPRIGGRRVEAQQALSDALGGAPVSVAATTTDHLGFLGRREGMAAVATALVGRPAPTP